MLQRHACQRLRLTRLIHVCLAFIALASASFVSGGELQRADIERRIQPPLRVGEKLRDIPAWPITSELDTSGEPVGYVFESVDLAPIPGFEGTPIDLLVSIDRKGNFMDVEVIHQHEPVFLGGLGEEPLREFVRQYRDKSLRQDISVSTVYGGGKSEGNRVVLDGITKATASVRIVNQSVLGAALAVARAKLGFAGSQKKAVATIRPDVSEQLSVAQLLDKGLVRRATLSNAQAEKLFAGTEGEGLDDTARTDPNGLFVDAYLACLNIPSVGRSLLGDAGYKALMDRLEPGSMAFWVATAGRYSFIEDDFVPGSAPARLSLMQSGLPIELRDLDMDLPVAEGLPQFNTRRILRVEGHAGFDPGQPFTLALTITRAKGMILPTLIHKPVELSMELPSRYLLTPPTPMPEWLRAWKDKALELGIIGAALTLLTVVLARPRTLSRNKRRLTLFRYGFLAFTLGFIGWYAQGQISIVQITGIIKSVLHGQGLGSLLYDPVTLLMMAFTIVSFFVWGRGTFCGWLCPFGALQEFTGRIGRLLRIPQWRPAPAVSKRLSKARHFILVVLLIAAAAVPSIAERLVEVEPFKTSITLAFDRSWPFVAYAALLLLAGMAHYKFFCRYLCPLGSAMLFGGRLRRWNWLPRRKECGKPCQTCKSRCEYDAIEKSGEIRYDDCFQCLDCVGIYHDDKRCAPLILRKKDIVIDEGRAVKLSKVE